MAAGSLELKHMYKETWTKVTSTLDVNIMTACNMAAGSLELKHMCKET